MAEHAPDRFWSGIDLAKTIAGVLAAVSAAVVGSFLGVAGTLIGAAVASLIGSVGTEVYHRSIDRGRKKLQGTFLTAPAAVGTPPVAAAADEAPSEQRDPARTIRWRRVALVAGAVFVLAMGTLTVAEILSGRSIADATRGETGNRSTLSSLFTSPGSRDSGDPAPAPATSTGPSDVSPAPGGPATTAPTEAPATEAPPTEAPPTEPGGGSTTVPETGTPTGGATDPGTGPDPGAADPPRADTQNADTRNADTQNRDTRNADNGTE